MQEAPTHLSEKSKSLWNDYISDMRSPGRKALLLLGLEALDRAEQARLLVKKEGLTTITGKSGVAHSHPGLSIQKEANNQAIKIFKLLGMNYPGKWAKVDPHSTDAFFK